MQIKNKRNINVHIAGFNMPRHASNAGRLCKGVFPRVVKHESGMKTCGCCQVETLSAVAGIFRAGFHAVLEVFQNMSDIF